mgnify:CR=1 FL=1
MLLAAYSVACCHFGSISNFSDNLNWKTYEIENFTVPQLSAEDIDYLDKLYSRYLSDIEAKANIRITSGESTYNVDSFKEYKIVTLQSHH